jgi:RNA polymerase sigma factor for flagellar operon FliA
MYNAQGKINDNDLIEAHLPLVRKVALHMRVRLPGNVDLDDLIQGGTFGLMDAVKKYDPSKGTTFESYARLRITGAIMDEVRKLDWVPRRYRRMAREISKAVSDLSKVLGRAPEEREVAEHMNMTLKEYQLWLGESNNGVILSYDLLGAEAVEDRSSAHTGSPLDELLDSSKREEVVKAIAQLSEREQQALGMYYLEEMNLKEIGLVLGVCESRVSQLHVRAVAKIRATLAA